MFDGECKNVQNSNKIASNSIKMLEIIFLMIQNSTFSGGACPCKDHHWQPTGHPTLWPLLSKFLDPPLELSILYVNTKQPFGFFTCHFLPNHRINLMNKGLGLCAHNSKYILRNYFENKQLLPLTKAILSKLLKIEPSNRSFCIQSLFQTVL